MKIKERDLTSLSFGIRLEKIDRIHQFPGRITEMFYRCTIIFQESILGSSIYPFEFSTLESHSSLDCERSWFKRILIKCSALPLEDPIRLNSSLNSWAHVSHASFDPNICPRGKRRLFENFSIDSRGSIETFRPFFFLSVILQTVYRYSLKFFSRPMFQIF